MVLEASPQNLFFYRRWRSPRNQAEAVAETRVALGTAFLHHTLPEKACRLQEGDIVHEIERLQRCVRASFPNYAALAHRRVKVDHHRRCNRAFPESVEAPAVKVLAVA